MNGIIDISKTLLSLSEHPQDVWTIDDATKGTAVIGGTGSGKTSASGKTMALSFLKEGWGGIVLCAKTDEAKLWEEYCNLPFINRGKDLIVFGKGSKFEEGRFKGKEMVFNPIDYEMKRSGEGAGETQNITNIFMNIYRMGNRIASEGDTKEERYWDTALKRCLNRVIELLKLSLEDLTYQNMVKVLSTSKELSSLSLEDMLNRLNPTGMSKHEREESIRDADRELAEPSNYCLKCLVEAYHFVNTDAEEENAVEKIQAYNLVEDYFLRDMPAMGDRTKSVVTESFMGLAEPFLSGLLFRHFSGATNICPEMIFEQNKIIVLNFPIKEYLDAGIIAQSVFKLMFQQAVERRDVNKYPTPVFLWCDEAQYFINPYDQIFLTTARSSRTATVFLSQNISNYFAVMGSGADAKARVDSLMGNLCTKIFHANSDAETNEYASRLIGNSMGTLLNRSEQSSPMNLLNTYSQGLATQFLPQVQPKEFTILKTGGPMHDYKVEAIIAVSGRKWSDDKNYIEVEFEQDFKH